MAKNKYLLKLRRLTINILKDEKVRIILFGSRGRGDNNPTSDVDIGLIPYGKIDEKKIILLKERIEELNIPYKVEIVNFSEASQDFRKEAMQGAIIWKD